MIHKWFIAVISFVAAQCAFASDQVQCRQMGNNIVVTATSNGVVYAVNGTARSMADSQGWKDGKEEFEPSDLQDLLKQGMKNCSSAGSTSSTMALQRSKEAEPAQATSSSTLKPKISSAFTREGFAKAASNGDIDTLKQYVASGFGVDTPGPDMPWLSQKGNPVIASAAAAKKCAAVEYLLSVGAKPDYKGVKFGWTPVAHAAQTGAADCVKALLAKGARSDVPLERGGDTPLIMAAYMGHLEVVRLLVEHGANLKTKNKDGDTAYRAALVGGSNATAQYLRSKGGQ